MSAVLQVALKALASLIALAGVALIPLGLPGNWVVVLAALGGVGLGTGWGPFLVILGAAVAAEALEFALGLGLARKGGAGRAGLWGAFLGGLAGGILLVPVAPPAGPLAGAAAGAFAGAVLAEFVWARRGARESLKAGAGAFLGVVAARVLKLLLGLLQALWLILSLWGFMGPGLPAD